VHIFGLNNTQGPQAEGGGFFPFWEKKKPSDKIIKMMRINLLFKTLFGIYTEQALQGMMPEICDELIT